MGLIIGLLVSVLIIIVHPFEGTGDFYHHINSGKWIVEHHQLMRTDVFSHTAYGLPVIDHSWASGVVYYLIFSTFGAWGVRIFVGALAGSVCGLAYWWVRKLGAEKVSAFLAALLLGAMLVVRWPDRPELFGYVFLLALLLVDRYTHKWHKLPLVWPIIIWLWGIFYGVGLLAAWGVVGMLMVMKYLTFIKRNDSKSYITGIKKITWYGVGFLLSLGAGFLNGYGTETILYFFKYIPKVAVYEAEWAGIWRLVHAMPAEMLPPYQWQIAGYLVWFFAVIALGVWGYKKHKDQRLWILVGMVAAAAPIFAFRQIVNAAIFATPIIALTRLGKYARIAMAVAILSFWGLFSRVEIMRMGSDTVINTSFEHLVEFIHTNKLSGNAFNHLHMGGRLTYALYPDVKVFYDTRDDLFLRTDAWQDLYTAFSNDESIVPLLHKYSVDLVIADVVTDQLNYRQLFLGPGWGVVYLNDRYLVALPKQVILEKHMSEVPVDIYLPGVLKPGREEQGLKFLETLWLSNPTSGNTSYLLRALVFLGRCDEARRIDSGIICKAK